MNEMNDAKLQVYIVLQGLIYAICRFCYFLAWKMLGDICVYDIMIF